MATKYWQSGITGSYSNQTYWGGSLPQSGDTAVIALGKVQINGGDALPSTLTFDIGQAELNWGVSSQSAIAVSSATLGAGITINDTAGGGSITPTSNGPIMLGSLGVNGEVVFDGTINVGAGDAMSIGIAANATTSPGYFDNAGVINVTGTAGNYGLAQVKQGNEGSGSLTGAYAYYGAVNLDYGIFYAKAPDSGPLAPASGGNFNLRDGSELAVVNTIFNTTSVTFQDATDALLLGQDGANQYVDYGEIYGFQAGDVIGLLSATVSPVIPAHANYDSANGTLDFTDAGGNAIGQVKLSGDYAGWTFSVSDAKASPIAGYASEYEITGAPCFCAGTLIATPEGEKPVEHLRAGDLVRTLDGAAKPVAWIGRRTIAAPFADPVHCWPIRVMAGALGEGVPSRDLLLSPDHALLTGAMLVHAGALVNGTSIVRETAVPRQFTYYHVELEDHSLILAENAPAETFVDNVDRMGFDNWDEHRAMFPDGKPVEEMAHPRAKSRRQVPQDLRDALDRRARALGLAADKAA